MHVGMGCDAHSATVGFWVVVAVFVVEEAVVFVRVNTEDTGSGVDAVESIWYGFVNPRAAATVVEVVALASTGGGVVDDGGGKGAAVTCPVIRPTDVVLPTLLPAPVMGAGDVVASGGTSGQLLHRPGHKILMGMPATDIASHWSNPIVWQRRGSSVP